MGQTTMRGQLLYVRQASLDAGGTLVPTNGPTSLELGNGMTLEVILGEDGETPTDDAIVIRNSLTGSEQRPDLSVLAGNSHTKRPVRVSCVAEYKGNVRATVAVHNPRFKSYDEFVTVPYQVI